MRIAAATALSMTCLWAQSGLDRPTLGIMLDANGATRAVYGVAGSVTLGDADLQGVLSTACSAKLCLAKTESSIVAAGQAIDAPPGPALFALDGEAAFVYFSQTRQLAHWHDNQLDSVDCAIDGEVLSLRAISGALEFAVRRGRRTWIVRAGNEIVDSIPGANGPVMLLKDAVIFATREAVTVRRSDGVETRFDVAGANAFLALGDGYVQIRSAGANYLLRVEAGREQLFLLPLAGTQLTLVSFDGATETAVFGTYDYGSVATGDTKDVRFRARNTGNSAVVLTTLSVIGVGFSKIGAPSLPYTIAPGNFLEFTARFTAGQQPGLVYSANLQVNGIAATLTATTVSTATLTAPVCTVADPIDFGRVQRGTSRTCNFSLSNSNVQPLIISTLAVTGTGFQGPQALIAPFTIPAGATVPFSINFTPPASILYPGTLTIGPRTYRLTGGGFDPPLPKPTLQFDSATIGSGQQHILTMTLPTPSPVTVSSGVVTLTFTSSVASDKSVFFVSGSSSSVAFSVKQGATQISLGGQPNAIFQTGTTAGTITFTVSGTPIDGDPTTTLTIPPQIISLDTVTASRRVNDLDIEVIGFDNTYTAGAMSFTFFDTAGKPINPGSIPADFTTNFHSYFATVTSGSSFLMRVTFPVTGDATQVGSVQVDLVNSAGTAHTHQINFQ